MANEITVSVNITALKRSTDGTKTLVQWNPQPTTFRADLAGSSGPYGGTVVAQLTETLINLSSLQVTPGGWAFFQNQDATNLVEVGLFVQEINRFAPFAELLPGEAMTVRLSRYVGLTEVPGTGTGTSGDANPSYLAVKASVAPVPVRVEIMPA